MKNNILVVSAHPDDEVLGVGGTILKHAKRGDDVTIMILGDGESSRGSEMSNIPKRKNQANEAAKTLGAQELILESFPDQRFDTIPLLEIIQKIEKVIYSLRPNIVYSHCPYDLNMDHRLTFQATLTALRPGPNCSVRKFLTFETLSSTEWQMKEQGSLFCPTVYHNITDFIDQKIEIMKIYADEIREYPHPRSEGGIRILAQYRGMESAYKYAEAFQTIRVLED